MSVAIERSTDTPRAILFMVVSMAFFATEDFFLKRVGAGLPSGQVLTILSGGCLAVFLTACLIARAPLFTRDIAHPLVAIRSLSEAGATLAYVVSLAFIPLALSSAIIQVQPILITAGAALWLGERVGPRRWGAVAVGLFGVLLILQPGLAGFQPMALLTLFTAVCLAARDLSARRIPDRVSNWQLGLWAFACVFLGALVMLGVQGTWQAPSLGQWRDLACAVAAFALAYLCIMAATRIGEVSAVIPFRYTRLVFALILAVVFLGERPDALTLIGAAVVIGSGLYAWWRERSRA